ncbi:MAG: SEC-C metal-binding domain-containing protein [Acidobacteriota bacterium]
MHEIIASARATTIDGGSLNDLYVLDRYVDFLKAYGLLWKSILEQQFGDSWSVLQDCLSFLRVIKKFSNIDVTFFEDQLIELEQTYPYNIFFSIGAVVDRFECSLCGRDIISDECPHMPGELYNGKMASAVAQDVVKLDHGSLVTSPADKRCVVRYEDTGEQFSVIRQLSRLITSNQCAISDCWRVHFSKETIPNSEYTKIGRNEKCFCGSGKKFKKCCISKQYVDSEHVNIVHESRSFEAAIR